MSTEARWPIRDGNRVGRGRESERLDRGNRPKKTGETVDCRQNNGSVKAVSPRHCPATCALCNCCFNCCAGQCLSLRQCLLHRCWRTTWTTRSKKTSNLLSPAPPPYSWSLLGKVEGPAPPPSSKISCSFDLAWNAFSVIAINAHTTFTFTYSSRDWINWKATANEQREDILVIDSWYISLRVSRLFHSSFENVLHCLCLVVCLRKKFNGHHPLDRFWVGISFLTTRFDV